MPRLLFVFALACLVGCQSALPETSPPLADMEEPPALFAEPDDEVERQALPLGCFSGVEVTDPRTTLEERLADGPAAGVLVADVVANSPGDAAGLVAGDLLLAAQVEGAWEVLTAPSQWRRIEQATTPGTAVAVRVDRAGVERQTRVTLTPRVRRTARLVATRLREEEKVGVVVRAATEVEAAAAGLGAGGGAVVVGLSRGSPWRVADVRFGDVLTAINGQAVTHPQVVLTAIRNAAGPDVHLESMRGDERRTVRAFLSSRASEVHEIGLPLVFFYGSDRGTTTTSMLLGLIHYKSTAAAWRLTLLWFLTFGAGDSDRLLEVAR